MTMKTMFNEDSANTGCHIFRCVICWKYIFESEDIFYFGDGYCHTICMYSIIRQSQKATQDRRIKVKPKRQVNRHHAWYPHTFGMESRR